MSYTPEVSVPREGRESSKTARVASLVAALALVTAACGGGGTTARPSGAASAGATQSAAVSAPAASSPATSPDASSPAASESAAASPSESAAASPSESAAASPSESAAASPSGSAAASPSGSGAASPGTGGTTSQLPKPTSPQALTLWNPFTGPDGGFFKKIVDDYNGANAECQITVQTQPGAEYVAKLEAARDGNQLPHIIAAGYDALPGLTESKIVTPIDDLASAAGLSESTFPAAIWNAGKWKDQRVGVPIDTHPMTFFYNKKLFRDAGLDPENPPADKASFEAAITAVKEKTGKDGYQMVTSGQGANFLVGLQFASLFYQAGGKWTSDDFGTATFNSDAGVQAAEYLVHLVNDLGVPKVESDAEIAAFKQGNNAMVFSGIWESTGYNDALKEDLGVAPVPAILGQGAWGGSHNLAVTAAATDDLRVCAYHFIDTFSRNSLQWAAAGQVPARNEVRESSELTGGTEGLLPIIAKVAPIAESVQFLPSIPGGGDILFAANGAGEAAVFALNGQPAKEVLDKAADFNTDVLTTNKERYGY